MRSQYSCKNDKQRIYSRRRSCDFILYMKRNDQWLEIHFATQYRLLHLLLYRCFECTIKPCTIPSIVHVHEVIPKFQRFKQTPYTMECFLLQILRCFDTLPLSIHQLTTNPTSNRSHKKSNNYKVY